MNSSLWLQNINILFVLTHESTVHNVECKYFWFYVLIMSEYYLISQNLKYLGFCLIDTILEIFFGYIGNIVARRRAFTHLEIKILSVLINEY